MERCIITCTVFQNPGSLPLHVTLGPPFEATGLSGDSQKSTGNGIQKNFVHMQNMAMILISETLNIRKWYHQLVTLVFLDGSGKVALYANRMNSTSSL